MTSQAIGDRREIERHYTSTSYCTTTLHYHPSVYLLIYFGVGTVAAFWPWEPMRGGQQRSHDEGGVANGHEALPVSLTTANPVMVHAAQHHKLLPLIEAQLLPRAWMVTKRSHRPDGQMRTPIRSLLLYSHACTTGLFDFCRFVAVLCLDDCCCSFTYISSSLLPTKFFPAFSLAEMYYVFLEF